MMPRLRLKNPWRVLWQIATSDYLLGVLLLLIALSLLLAACLPQTSAEGRYLDLGWQGEVQRRFGGNAQFETIRSSLQAIGAFNVADAAGFRLMLALLALSLLTRLVDSVEAFWLTRQDDPLSKEIPLDDAAKEQENDKDELKETPERAHRWDWAELGSAGVYLGGLLFLLGVVITDLSSWQVGPLPIAPGESIPLQDGSDLTLHLASLTQDGRHGDGEIWRGRETLLGAGALDVGRPLSGGRVGVFLVGSGPGIRVQATLSDTQSLKLVTGPDTIAENDLVLAFTKEEPRHMVGVSQSQADLVLMLSMPEPGALNTHPRIQVFESGSGEFILEQNVSANTTLTVRDVSFGLSLIPYALVRAVHDPGAFWSQIGAIVLIAGAITRGWWVGKRE